MTRLAARRGVRHRARDLDGWVFRDTINCIMIGERPGRRGPSRYNRLYRDRRKAWPLAVSRCNAATRTSIRHDTTRRRVTRPRGAATRSSVARTGVQRHGELGTTCDTAERAM